MNPLRLFVAVALIAATVSAPAPAQGVPVGPRFAVSGAPVLAQQAVGVRRLADAPVPLPHPAPFRADTHQNRALMIVGGAGMLTGAVLGGNAGGLISVGGAVVFLWGLYQYMN
jgi:hypothetical protein